MNQQKKVRQKNLMVELSLAKKEGFFTSINIQLKSPGMCKIDYDPDALLYAEDWYNYTHNPKTVEFEELVKEDFKDFPNIDIVYLSLFPGISDNSIEKLSNYISKKYDCRCIRSLNSLTIFSFN